MTDAFYDDPELQSDDSMVSFNRPGDRVRGRITGMEIITTRYGRVPRYTLFDLDRETERTMLAGATRLWQQLSKLRPGVGDTIDVELTELQRIPNSANTVKIFEVHMEPEATQDEIPF